MKDILDFLDINDEKLKVLIFLNNNVSFDNLTSACSPTIEFRNEVTLKRRTDDPRLYDALYSCLAESVGVDCSDVYELFQEYGPNSYMEVTTSLELQ